MKGYIPEDKVEEIKSRTDIVDVISQYVTLKKAGRNLLGLCPFHKEKTPSFTVSQEKQIFYCFGCGEGGNAISFLMKVSQMSYPEALRHLAAKTGVIIPEKAISREEKAKVGIREQIYRLNEQAATRFTGNLFSTAGNGARSYLKKRGIQEEAVRTFRLGFSLDNWRHLHDYLSREKAPLKIAEQAGLLIAKDGGGFYDRFRGRLIFPIEDASGRIIAFGGRVIAEGEPKYINSPESPVYIKGRNLYGLFRTREDIRKAGYAILVEGYFDLIALWNAGVRNVIASLGTALTKDQVDLIRRHTGQIAAIFDPDEAGKKALARSLELFLAGNVKARAVILPDGHDPDDYIRKFGKESFEALVKNSASMVDYYIDNIIGYERGLERDREILRDAVSFIVNINDRKERGLFIKRVSERLGIEQYVLQSEVKKVIDTPASPTLSGKQPSLGDKGNIDPVELKLIHILLEFPEKIADVDDANVLLFFSSTDLKKVGETVFDAFRKEGRIDTAVIIEGIDNPHLKDKLMRMMVDETPYDREVIDRFVVDTIRQIKKKWHREKTKVFKIELIKAQECGDGPLCDRLLSDIERLIREEKGL